MKKYTKRIVIIFSIVVISFVIFFAGVTVGIYHMNNEMTKLHSVMSATSTLDVLSSLRKNQVHNAIELLEDQLDMYGSGLRLTYVNSLGCPDDTK